MVQPVLVVDFGAQTTAAALVVGERAALIRDPLTGLATRPSPAGALAAFLGALRTEALRVCTDQVERLTLMVPTGLTASDPRRDALIAAGDAAGFRDVELVDETVATMLEARSVWAVPDASLVLVCDLGESWSTTLVYVNGDESVVVGHQSSPAGRDLDAMLVDDLRTHSPEWVEPILGGVDGVGKHEVAAFLRRLKHEVAGAPDAMGALRPGMPPYRLTADWLDRLAEPGLRWVVASARSLLARASAGVSGVVRPGSTTADIAGVVLVGGAAHIRNAERILASGLQRPVVLPAEPELAVMRGGVRWVATAAHRRIVAEHPRWRVEPLSWPVPGGRARLVRWSVAEGEAYPRGAVLAQVRTPDERVFDLTAPDDGTMVSQLARVGDLVGPTVEAMSKRPASCLAGDPPGFRQQLSAAGDWLLLADRQLLVECDAGARLVRLWSIADGVPVSSFAPALDNDHPHTGRVFVDPYGRLSLVAWDATGLFSVWDVQAERRVASFRDTNVPARVMVNEGQWRLTAEGEDTTSAGRYRRNVATVWDLGTGRRLEKLDDDWQRHLSGYGQRSVVDGFGERALSPDGRLCAVSVRTPAGAPAIALQSSTNDHEVFRAEQPSLRARTAFSSDGRLLLANWESDRRSQVDVWEL